MIDIPAEVVARMREHAASTYPEECCGGLLGRSTAEGTVAVVRAAAVNNTRTEERERRYLIGPENVLELERAAQRRQLELVGFYHSHPDHPARPSDFDREHAWPWYTYVIVPVQAGSAGEPRAWRLGDDRAGFEEQQIRSQQETL